jgi:carboxyl-terminal processing protease
MIRRGLLFAVGALLAAAPLRAQDTLATGIAAATFDSVWTRIDRTFYDTAFLRTRWAPLRDSLRPVAAAARSNAELRQTLQVLLGQIGVSHFGLITAEASPALAPAEAIATATPGGIGVETRLTGDTLVVFRVRPGGAGWRAGLRPGDRVLAIADRPVADVIAPLASIMEPSVRTQSRYQVVAGANARLNRAPGDTVSLTVASADGAERTLRVVSESAAGRVQKFGNLPPMPTTVDVSERVVDGKRIGIVAFSIWLPVAVAQIDSAVDRLRDADALVFDLRGNPGGVAAMIGGVAGHVLDSAVVLGTLTQRGLALTLRANPRRVSTAAQRVTPFAGPVAVLVDGMSASASEFFAAGLQGLGRARVFGETSAGASVPALMGRLPNGDVLMHAIADHSDSRGRRVEGVGVIPDETVPLRAASLAAGRDEVVEAALRWAAGRTRPQPQ